MKEKLRKQGYSEEYIKGYLEALNFKDNHIIPDKNIVMIWEDAFGNRKELTPSWYEENSMLIDDSGEEMVYLHTVFRD